MTILWTWIALGVCALGWGDNAQGKPWRLGVPFPGPHQLVTNVMDGLRAGLNDTNWKEGRDYVLIEMSADGDPNKFATVCQRLVSGGVDVLMPISTPMSQAAVKESGERIPVVFIAVTDPVGAGILPSLAGHGKNITGVSDAWPYREQLQLIKRIMPKVSNIGVLYNESEANSVYGIQQIRKNAAQLGLTIVDGTVAGPSDITARSSSLIVAHNVDVLFLSSDNTILGAAEAAIKVGIEHRIPVFSGDSGTVERGAVGAVSIGYFGVGRLASRLVADVLNGRSAASLPVIVAQGNDIYINLNTASRVKLRIPPEVLADAKTIYGKWTEDQSELYTLARLLWIAVPTFALVVVCLWALKRRRTRGTKVD